MRSSSSSDFTGDQDLHDVWQSVNYPDLEVQILSFKPCSHKKMGTDNFSSQGLLKELRPIIGEDIVLSLCRS